MKIRDIMTRDVKSVSADAPARDAARLMKEMDVGLLPVLDGDELMGMVTDRDIALRLVAEGREPMATRVRDILTPDVVYAYEDQDVEEAAAVMGHHQIRRLIVLDRDNRLVGIVALADLANQTGDDKLTGEALSRVSKPS